MIGSGSVMVSGSIRGHELYFIHGAADLDQTAARYLPMGYGLAEAASAAYPTRFVCPARGRLVKSMIRCKAAAASTALTLYKAVNGTNAPATAGETKIVNIASVDTTYSFTFTGSHHFNAGDVISLRVNPTNNPDETNFTHVFELYTRADIPTGTLS